MFVSMNHPNSFMDPIAFSAYLYYPKTYYMARGDAFKKGIVTRMLESIGIVPIFRLRDGGYESVKKNLETFKTAYGLFDNNQKIMVFSEGISMQERRLRPIQKGTAKMALSYLEQGGNKALKILPIGVTYSKPSKFRGDVLYQIGEAISVSDYFEEYKEHPAVAVNKLTAKIHERMQPLIPTLKHTGNDVLIEQLQPILKREFIVKNKLNYNDLNDQQKYWEYITEKLNMMTEAEPERVEAIRSEVNDYSLKLSAHRIHDVLLYDIQQKKPDLNFINILLLILGYPLYAIGKILNYIPYYFGKHIAEKNCRNIEFYAAVSFGAGSLIWQFSFLIELLILGLVLKSVIAVGVYAFMKIFSGWFGLQYSPFRKRMTGAFRLNKLKRKDAGTYKSLLAGREKIVQKFIG